MTAAWEELDHTADVAVRLTAPNLAGLLEVGCRAMFELMYGPAAEETNRERPLEVSGDGAEMLLWEWLSAALSWSEVDRAAWYRPEVVVSGGGARGVLRGVGIDGRELVGPPIKAVTLHDLEVNPAYRGIEAVVVFDV